MTLVVQNALDPALLTNTLATLTGSQIVTNKTLKAVKEPVTITGTPPAVYGTITNFDVVTQSIVLYNTAIGNFGINIRGDSTTTLNSMLAVGESIGISFFVPNGATAYRLIDLQIDGFSYPNTQNGKFMYYQNGSQITAGNTNATDLYMLFLIKTANNNFNVYMSQTKYA